MIIWGENGQGKKRSVKSISTPQPVINYEQKENINKPIDNKSNDFDIRGVMDFINKKD